MFSRSNWWGGAFLMLALSVLFALGVPQAARGQTYNTFMKYKGAMIPVIVVCQDAVIYDQHGCRTAETAKFMEQHYLVAQKEIGGIKYSLAARPDELSLNEELRPTLKIGWFKEEDVLIGQEAMKLEGVYRKGLVVTRAMGKGGKDRNVAGKAHLRTGPGDKYKSNRIAQLYRFYYVYKIKQIGKTKYYLLGGSDTIQSVDQPGNTIFGWISQDRMLAWNTRQAIEFERSTLGERKSNPAKIYMTEKEVLAKIKADLAGSQPQGLAQPLAEEDPNGSPWAHDVQRFPLLETKPNPQYQSLGCLQKIGFIGDIIYTDQSDLISAKDSAGDRDRISHDNFRRKFAIAIGSLNNLEICFVIDSTGSMREYFASVADGVERIIDYIKTRYDASTDKERPDVRFSVVFYRDFWDFDGQPDPDDTYTIKREPYTANATMIKALIKNEIKTPCDGCGKSGDEPEAVFYAIDQAVKRGEEEVNRNAHKVIILIGDNGNHRQDRLGLTSERIADTLVEKGYEFFPIQVADQARIDRELGCLLFHTQTRKIMDLIDRKTGSSLRGVNSSNPERVAQAIVEYAQGAIKAAQDAKKVAKEMINGTGINEALKKIPGGKSYGLIIQRRLTRLMIQNNINPQDFIHGSINPFGEGWIAERETLSKLKQTKTMLLLEKSNLNLLIKLLIGLERAGADHHNMLRLWTDVVKKHLGESDIKKKKAADLFRVHLGLPMRMNLLQYSLAQILTLPPQKIKEEIANLRIKRRLLQCIAEERQCEIRNNKVVETGERKVWWDLPEHIAQGLGEGRYGWIPADELP